MRSTLWTAVAGVALGVILIGDVAVAQGPRPWASRVPKDLVRKPNPLPADAKTVADGKLVYENTCLPCHGEGAQGDGPAAQFIVPPPKPLIVNGKLSVPDGVAFWVITNGIDGTGMASLGDALNDNERWSVIRYLGAMAKGAQAPAPAATPAPTPDAPIAPAPGSGPAPGTVPAPAGDGAGKDATAPTKPSR